MGVAVTPEATVSADPRYVPLGAPVLLSLDRAEPNGIWIAQDTGGAIKGANRFDSFWGAGSNARSVAGGMSARGSALVLLPKIGRAHVCTPVTNARLVCRLLLEKKKQTNAHSHRS